MDYKEALALIEDTCHKCKLGNCAECINIPIKNALEIQIEKKPIHEHKNYYCPICKEDGWVLWDDAEPNDFDNFCGKCGQALDWRKEI